MESSEPGFTGEVETGAGGVTRLRRAGVAVEVMRKAAFSVQLPVARSLLGESEERADMRG